MLDRHRISDVLLESPPDFIVLAPTYPNSTQNGGEFIRTRVHAYVAAGLRGHVIDYRAADGSTPVTLHDGATPISVTSQEGVSELASVIRSLRIPVLAHSPTPEISRILREELDPELCIVWYHGYEVRDYRRLLCNFLPHRLAQLRSSLDQMNRDRFAAAAPVFEHPGIHKVFVSDFQRRYSEWDVGVAAVNSHIIPNHIDTNFYKARVRAPEESRKILLMRSFKARNYANDVALRAIELLSARSEFCDLQITVRGFGPHFAPEVARVRHLPNVDVQEAYSSPAQMAMLHYDHGVFLCPSRYDTQGVMLGEAMASGMVTITNPVAAIPEYTDETTSLMPRTDDPRAFAEAIWFLVQNPQIMPAMSAKAAQRVDEQCGSDATIGREIAIIRSLQP